MKHTSEHVFFFFLYLDCTIVGFLFPGNHSIFSRRKVPVGNTPIPHRPCLNVRCHSIVITAAVLAQCVSVMKDGGQRQTTCPRKSCDSFTTGATRRLRAQSTPTKELLCMRYPLILNSCCIYQQF